METNKWDFNSFSEEYAKLNARLENLKKSRDNLVSQKDMCDEEINLLCENLDKLRQIESVLRNSQEIKKESKYLWFHTSTSFGLLIILGGLAVTTTIPMPISFIIGAVSVIITSIKMYHSLIGQIGIDEDKKIIATCSLEEIVEEKQRLEESLRRQMNKREAIVADLVFVNKNLGEVENAVSKMLDIMMEKMLDIEVENWQNTPQNNMSPEDDYKLERKI